MTRAMAERASKDNENLLQDDFSLSETFMGHLDDHFVYHPPCSDSSLIQETSLNSSCSRCKEISQEGSKFEDLSLSRNQLILEQEKD